MSGPEWLAGALYLGRVQIGAVRPYDGPKPGKFVGLSFLPGARQVIGYYDDEPTARQLVEQSANSRVKAMFGAGMRTTSTAASEGRELRQIARALCRSGVWSCDRPVNGGKLFGDLARACGLARDDMPKARVKPTPDNLWRSDVTLEPEIEAGELID